MAFVPRGDWKNYPDTSTPIKAEDMIRIEAGVSAAHDAVAALPAPLALGTTAGTALAGNTSLLKLGTTASTALAGNTTIPAAPAAGTAAQLTAGTDTTVRSWAAKVLADEIDARVAAAIAAIPPAE